MAKRTLRKTKVSIIVNLVNIFNDAFKSRTKEFRSALRPRISSTKFKAEFGKRYTDKIVDNTTQSKTKEGSKFPDNTYSKEYAKKKGRTGPVDLLLSGDMLNSLRGKISGTREITISIEGSTAPRAHGHITGGGNLPRRDFFGLPRKDEVKIMLDTVKALANG